MTLVAAVTALADRWLTERTFELVVAPAIADMQFDTAATGLRRARNGAAVVSAFLWGVYEEVTSDPGHGTVVELASGRLLFVDDASGKVASVPLSGPGGPRRVSSLSCKRFYTAARQGLCLADASGPLADCIL